MVREHPQALPPYGPFFLGTSVTPAYLTLSPLTQPCLESGMSFL